ncbi:hypothetical protein G3M53_20345, partial [Streptomyces sp. SID7982]|nr:hypothetical protein [Streptomyces sp. SID7982]
DADEAVTTALRTEMAAAGAVLTTVRHTDPADAAPLVEALAALAADRPLTAIVHTGDTGDTGDTGAEDAPGINEARAAYEALVTAAGSRQLDAFVVFGSISAV